MSDLTGKVTVVTGAGSGIGSAVAEALARAGASVVATDRNGPSAEAVRDRILAAGGEAIAVTMDVTDRSSVVAGLAAAVDRYGQLDVLFNNAGILRENPFLEVTEDDWRQLMTVNGLGTLICTQEAAKIMIAQGRGGKIVNTTSITARQANANFAHYAASKAVVSSLIQSGARALAPHGITVMGFAPGIVQTEMWEGVQTDPSARRQKMDDYAKKILVGRVSTPEDLTPIAVFLAGPGSDYMTGQVVMVDGGMVLV
ncbi:(S)-acetoin forming diacetyl reductase [Micromonospora sonneratiae]|uniref:SDR family NAD(P)-dependent oxidoreductase n=1 Tax=Micromonospora sonneratiae TaxID=1184706 RepID=A0ABW3YJC1_9ACTN